MDHLEISGPIGPDSTAAIHRILQNVKSCTTINPYRTFSPVAYLNSTGGTLKDGYALGKLLRQHQVMTRVTGGQQCSSACAIAFLGGLYRNISADGKLLFHSPYRTAGLAIECIDRERATELRRYIVDFLGAKNGDFVFERTMAFCSQQSGWEINGDAARLFGITTQ